MLYDGEATATSLLLVCLLYTVLQIYCIQVIKEVGITNLSKSSKHLGDNAMVDYQHSHMDQGKALSSPKVSSREGFTTNMSMRN